MGNVALFFAKNTGLCVALPISSVIVKLALSTIVSVSTPLIYIQPKSTPSTITCSFIINPDKSCIFTFTPVFLYVI